MKMRKGVSPLIAAVLLIAFTMAVAAILTAWITSFTKEQTDIIGDETTKFVQCQFAGLSIFDAVWNSGSNRLTVSIANTGTVDLAKINVFAFIEDNRYVGSAESIESADIVSVQIDDITAKPDRVRITSVDCPTVSDEEISITSN